MSKLSIKNICKGDMLVIDFYNIYCSYIRFSEVKRFDKESIVSCLIELCEICKNNITYIVSKNIYETEGLEAIQNIIQDYPNITYYIVLDDDHTSSNRERDDFVVLYYYQKFRTTWDREKHKIKIISKDKFRNYSNIIDATKDFSLIVCGKHVGYEQAIVKCNVSNMKKFIRMNTHELNLLKFQICSR